MRNTIQYLQCSYEKEIKIYEIEKKRGKIEKEKSLIITRSMMRQN